LLGQPPHHLVGVLIGIGTDLARQPLEVLKLLSRVFLGFLLGMTQVA
jgi:hypothetical protein